MTKADSIYLFNLVSSDRFNLHLTYLVHPDKKLEFHPTYPIYPTYPVNFVTAQPSLRLRAFALKICSTVSYEN